MAHHHSYGAIANTGAAGSGSSIITSINNNPLPEVNFSGFSPTEFVSLSEAIGHNISAINSQSRQLEKSFKLLGTERDLPTIRDRAHSIIQKCNNRINMTSVDLQSLAIIVKRGDKQHKLQLERLSSEFCEVVEKYGDLQKKFLTKAIQCKPQKLRMNGENGTDEDEKQTSADNGHANIKQQQLLQDFQSEYDSIVDREQQIQEIAKDILDVNSIMKAIAKLMQSQGEELDRIETNVENIASNVEAGREELIKASRRRQSKRRKILILFCIAVIIGLIITGIVFSKLAS